MAKDYLTIINDVTSLAATVTSDYQKSDITLEAAETLLAKLDQQLMKIRTADPAVTSNLTAAHEFINKQRSIVTRKPGDIIAQPLPNGRPSRRL